MNWSFCSRQLTCRYNVQGQCCSKTPNVNGEPCYYLHDYICTCSNNLTYFVQATICKRILRIHVCSECLAAVAVAQMHEVIWKFVSALCCVAGWLRSFHTANVASLGGGLCIDKNSWSRSNPARGQFDTSNLITLPNAEQELTRSQNTHAWTKEQIWTNICKHLKTVAVPFPYHCLFCSSLI